MSVDFVYLASGSPRRRELLQQIGVRFHVLTIEVDESVVAGESPAAYVVRVAAAKATAGAAQRPAANWPALTETEPSWRIPDAPVLAADTAVVLDGEVLGKPKDAPDALRMLARLSERTHEVLTAVALIAAGTLAARLSRSEVTFRAISTREAQAYWDTGEPRDKAGAYAIQGRAALFIAQLRGSYSGVMGLPLYETGELLGLAGAPARGIIDTP